MKAFGLSAFLCLVIGFSSYAAPNPSGTINISSKIAHYGSDVPFVFYGAGGDFCTDFWLIDVLVVKVDGVNLEAEENYDLIEEEGCYEKSKESDVRILNIKLDDFIFAKYEGPDGYRLFQYEIPKKFSFLEVFYKDRSDVTGLAVYRLVVEKKN